MRETVEKLNKLQAAGRRAAIGWLGYKSTVFSPAKLKLSVCKPTPPQTYDSKFVSLPRHRLTILSL